MQRFVSSLPAYLENILSRSIFSVTFSFGYILVFKVSSWWFFNSKYKNKRKIVCSGSGGIYFKRLIYVSTSLSALLRTISSSDMVYMFLIWYHVFKCQTYIELYSFCVSCFNFLIIFYFLPFFIWSDICLHSTRCMHHACQHMLSGKLKKMNRTFYNGRKRCIRFTLYIWLAFFCFHLLFHVFRLRCY